MTAGLRTILRARKPDKRAAQFTHRPDSDLIGAADIAGTGRVVFVPDTNIYIMDAAGKMGLPVLTNNKGEFDLLQQVAPGGRFIFVESGPSIPTPGPGSIAR